MPQDAREAPISALRHNDFGAVLETFALLPAYMAIQTRSREADLDGKGVMDFGQHSPRRHWGRRIAPAGPVTLRFRAS